MLLSDEEKRMKAGEYGPGTQRAMDLLAKYGDSFDAENFAQTSYGHISYDFCPEEFWNLMTEGVGKTPHRVTKHPSYSPEVWKKWGYHLPTIGLMSMRGN